MEDLEPDASYEVFVQARNFYGFGDPTTRIVFRTAKKRISTLIKAATDFDYDQQGCCSRAGKNRLWFKNKCMEILRKNISFF